MPNTGNQADTLRNVPDTVPEDVYWALQQLISSANGSFGSRWRLIGYNSSTNYALEVRNQDGANGLSMVCYDDTGARLLDVKKASVTIGPPLSAGAVTLAGALAAASASFSGAVTMASTLAVTISGANLLDLAASLVKIAASAGLTADVHIAETSGNVYIGSVNTDATDIMMGGTSSFIGITGSLVWINGGVPYTTTNPPVSSSVTGTYTGNGGVTQRQITTGFQVKSLILERVSTGSQWLSQNQSNSTFIGTGPTIQQQSAVHLHASNGFWVADGSVNGNTSGETFNYTVFR